MRQPRFRASALIILLYFSMLPRYRLGLDLGTNSLGWSMLELDENNYPVRVHRLGVRIFSDGRDPKTEVSLAAARTQARGQRIRRERFLKRRTDLLAKLVALGLFPSDKNVGRNLATLDPYELRSKALNEKLHPFHLGRALLHLARRRGFKSNRKSAKTDEAKVTGPAIAKLESALDGKTIGQLLQQRLAQGQPTRFRPNSKQGYDLYPTRAMYEREFDEIVRSQKPQHEKISESDWQALRKIIFDQLPLKAPARGRCRFLKGADGKPLERAPLALPSFQQFRILSDANHLAYRDDLGSPAQPLTPAQRGIVLDLLRTQKTRSFGKLRTALNLPDTARFNLESDKRDELAGDSVAYLLANKKYFGRRWHDLPLAQRDAIVTDLLDDSIEDDVLRLRAEQVWGLSAEAATAIVELSPQDFPRGMAPFSGEFSRRLVPPMVTGLGYAAAVEAIGFKHSLANDDGRAESLPYYGKAMPESTTLAPKSHVADEREFGRIANPTVHIALNQLRIVVNTLIARYGKPAQITLELARNLKLTTKQRVELEKEQAKNKKNNDRLRHELRDFGEPDDYDNRLRLKLWEELKGDLHARVCPYSGRPIPRSILFTDEVEIDHILPFGATLDDSPANKILALRAANRAKGKRSPHEAFGADAANYADILDRAAQLPGNKRWRFQSDAMDKFRDTQGFLHRQLTDTQYLAKISARYLTTICPPSGVKVFPGRLTALLRHHWGLDTLLAQPDADRIAKNRADHRHHAIDALVVALADQRTLLHIQHANEANRIGDIAVPTPWPTLRAEAEAVVAAIIVSHRPNHSAAGALHEEKFYGPVRGIPDGDKYAAWRNERAWEQEYKYDLVYRVKVDEITHANLDPRNTRAGCVRDRKLRERLADCLAHVPIEPSSSDEKETKESKKERLEALAKALATFTRESGVRTVRLVKKKASVALSHHKRAMPRAVIPGGVHCVTFWQMPDKQIWAVALNLFEASRSYPRSGKTSKDEVWQGPQGQKIYRGKRPHPSAKLLFTVHKDDALQTTTLDGELRVVRVSSIAPSENNEQLWCFEHTTSGTGRKWNIKFSRILVTKTRLIHVNPIGDVQDSGPRQ